MKSKFPILETDMPTNQKVLKSNRVYPDMVLRNRYYHRAHRASSMKIMLFMISLFPETKMKGGLLMGSVDG